MDPAAIIADLASAHFSLSQVAARHGLTLDALAAFISSDQTQQKLDQLQSAAAISTRFAAQLHLPLAVAALGTLLARHRAVACSSAPQTTSALRREARSPSDEARSGFLAIYPFPFPVHTRSLYHSHSFPYFLHFPS